MSPTATPTARHRHDLPQLADDLFVTDGGLETTLIFREGLELPDFAAFTLLADAGSRAILARDFARYAQVARRHGVGLVLETPTWRASRDWGCRLGYSDEELHEANRAAVALLEEIRADHERPTTPVVISGCIGPRGDGYDAGSTMTAQEAEAYHDPQVRTFAASSADLVGALTMTNVAEAVGIARAAAAATIPVVISFTVETDGRLPSGVALGAAIEAVDAATDAAPAYYMVNCAHPTHFAHVLDPGAGWTTRLRGIRANASTLSHDELDEATDLDRGDPMDLSERYRSLRVTHPQVTVVGGCCGTDHHHVAAIAGACSV